MKQLKQSLSLDINKTLFYIAYLNFRKNMDFENFSEEEWKKAFEIERPLTEIRHLEDFE